ncbi:hypothetical protein AMTRI_Chr01g137110 [Amborella trichopoda]
MASLHLLGLLPLYLLSFSLLCDVSTTIAAPLPTFREAPAFRNSDSCMNPRPSGPIHVAMTLDANYLRGSLAAVLSILQHASCPQDITFHFLASGRESKLQSALKASFPYLSFSLHHFDPARVKALISASVRRALDQPLNYARAYLTAILPANVNRVVYLDSDLILVDDIFKLWDVDLKGKVLGAPEYCHANFTTYFTPAFWSDRKLAASFRGRKPCYFNTGVMIIDIQRWRLGSYTRRIENWMEIQKNKRIYELGSLPPFLLVFAGNIQGVDHRWNQHGLGGDNLEGKCRDLHPGPVSLLHWSGKGKPWLRLDARRPCPIDSLWAPYDLFQSSSLRFDL